jgi:hypothetical protein
MKPAFILLVFCFLALACNNSSSYENSKENLYEKEKENPVQFISISGNNKRNFLGQTVVRATIHNKASVCSYDDVRIKLLYYNKDGQQVANHEDELEKPLAANSTVKFTTRYFTPKGTDSVAMSIMSAKALPAKEENKK